MRNPPHECDRAAQTTDPAQGETEQPPSGREAAASDTRSAEIDAIYRAAPVGLCVLDTELRYVRINERLAEINGVAAEDHVGRRVREVVPWLADEAEPLLRRVIVTGEPVLDLEISGETLAHPGRSRTWVESWLPLRAPDGSVVGVNAVVHEITDRKEAERQLRLANEQLEERVAERTALAETRARQLERLAVELIEAEERGRRQTAQLLHDDLQQLLAGARMQVAAAAARLTDSHELQMVDEILSQAIESTRRLSHQLSPTVLHQSGLTVALDWLGREMNDRFGLEVEVVSDSASEVEGDRVKLIVYRAVQELLFNVVKHAKVNRARVVVSTDHDSIVAVVEDHGRGFDPALLSRDRLDGLGLPSLRERVSAIGGTLEVDTRPGGGSRVAVSLPRRAGSRATAV